MSFTVYTKEGCPYCDKIISVLDSLSSTRGFPIVVYTLGEEFTKEQFYAEFGESSTFPQVVMNDKKLGGSSDTIKYLLEQKII